ncbi:hypothetical protein [Neobacillus niacini]|uniref:hypothetical protein n=1 Tax=Neobacillus niacini TaxID=86668 RepID=UPI003982DB00
MDKVVMAGVFDFVNFHVCKALLDKGIEVTGVQIDNEEDHEILVEKRLEIGRNANFTEVSLEEILNNSLEHDTIILSAYDLFMRYKEDYLLENGKINNLMSLNNWGGQLVILAPSQMLTHDFDTKAEIVIDDFIVRTTAQKKDFHVLFLPTIYGIWQPETFIFQNSILTEMNRGKPFRGLREETSDAIYVEDAVHSILEIVEKRPPGRYLLESEKRNQWKLCASFLHINETSSNERKTEKIEDDITIYTVKNTTSIADGLTKQIVHAKRINS